MACPRYAPVRDLGDIERFAEQAGWPVVLKAVSGGYDGKGVWVCAAPGEAAEVAGLDLRLLAEEYVSFDRELAVLVARSPHRQGAAYPVVQTVQRDGICREVLAPAPGLAADRAEAAQSLALRIAAELDVTGLLAVELFETPGGLLVNELAMRPHNCGHWTIEGAVTSQFEQHLRAVLDLPLGAPGLLAPQVVMANLLGGTDPGRLRPVHPCDGRRSRRQGPPVRQGGPSRPQDRPRHGARRRRRRATGPGPPRRELPALGDRGRRLRVARDAIATRARRKAARS